MVLCPWKRRQNTRLGNRRRRKWKGLVEILIDPVNAFNATVQDLSDTIDEEGICYGVGLALPEIVELILLKGGGKVATGTIKVTEKASDVGLGIKTLEKTTDTAKVTGKSLHVTNTVDSMDDIGDAVSNPEVSRINLWKKSGCNSDELYNYLIKNASLDEVNKFLKEGKWPEGIQIPKNSSVVNLDGSINWSKAKNGGYTLRDNGTAIKDGFIPEIGEKIDRYGNANGRYTSPIINGQPYSYTQRSLPYVEDLSNYHQYEVIGDFNKIEEYVKNCSDIKLKTQIDAGVTKYYDGNYSKVVSYKGEIAKIEGWGIGGGIQYEFPIIVDQLERLGLLKEIK